MEEQESESFKPINIRDVFATKSPQLAKFIPGFIYSYLTRIIHIDFINDFLQRNGHLKEMEFINQVVWEFNVREQIYGFDNIPRTGRFIFASNHPLGGFDGMLLAKNVSKILSPPMFLSNDILMNIPNLNEMFVPVNKHGGHSREAARLLDDTYRSEKPIVIFPAGLASRRIKGKIVDLEWKKHFITKAVQHKRDIIPVFVSGRNTDRFYMLANIRKFLKIKWNLEMFFLPDETIRHRNSDIQIYFGKPMSYKMFDKSKTQIEWAEYVKDIVYSLPSEKFKEIKKQQAG